MAFQSVAFAAVVLLTIVGTNSGKREKIENDQTNIQNTD